MQKYKLFLDLDGVLADFDHAVFALFGESPESIHPARMWSRLAKTPDFYAHLLWMEDGRILWDAVSHLQPTILTGLPRGTWAESQKREWCARELGPEVPVITCMSRDKHLQAAETRSNGLTPVLVDERGSLAEKWESAGGIFIHHRSARESIEELKRYSVLG
ncbi:MAG: hypothetical protein ACOCVC_08015 [Spirochaeta sp.]